MTMTPWEEIVLDLFTEVSILEPLISMRVEREQAQGLGETGMAILVSLSRLGDVGNSRASVMWKFEEENNNNTEQEIDKLIARGLIDVSPDPVSGEQLFKISESGKATMVAALRALLPYFKPALEEVSVESIQQSTQTLREIRRTLDNLPDS
jgi:DNA-binding MarR family transcriptional regulator